MRRGGVISAQNPRQRTHRSSCGRRIPPLANATEPNQVVSGECPCRPATRFRQAHQRQLAQSADRLHPAEALLDAFAHLLAHRVARAARTACVDGTASSFRMPGIRSAHRSTQLMIDCAYDKLRGKECLNSLLEQVKLNVGNSGVFAMCGGIDEFQEIAPQTANCKLKPTSETSLAVFLWSSC
jgi:hypothetical protein